MMNPNAALGLGRTSEEEQEEVQRTARQCLHVFANGNTSPGSKCAIPALPPAAGAAAAILALGSGLANTNADYVAR